MMLGLRPTSRRSGKVNVLGFDPAREPLQAKRRVGYLPDSVGFYDHLTAIENLSYTAKLMGLSFPERSQRIADALSCVHLSDVAHKRVATFSRGMRQRIGLAEIIVKRAAIAILDEPTSGVDLQATIEFLELIGELKHAGTTVLLSSHLLDQVQRICDRVALFSQPRVMVRAGIVIVSGQPQNVDYRRAIVGLAAKMRLPMVYPYREFVEDGGLAGIELLTKRLQVARETVPALNGGR